MLALAERLPRDRFEPELILRSPHGVYGERARRASVPIRITNGHGPEDGNGGRRDRAMKLAELARTVRAAHYDVIDAWLYPMDVAVALAGPFIRRPVVLSGRRNLGSHDRFGAAEPVVAALSNRLFDTVVANSDAAARHAIASQGANPARVRVIRNGVEIPAPVSDADRAARRRELGATSDDILIGCVASYTSSKRLDLLIDAFAIVVRNEPRALLELVGDGPLRGELQAQIRGLGLESRVCLHGFERDPESLYSAFDVVTLSSDREGLPNALLEAGAAGRPIVSTRAGGAVEIVSDGETGLLVPVGDRDALAAALLRLIRDPDLADRLGSAIVPFIARTYGMDRFVAEFGALYEECVAVRHGSSRRGEIDPVRQ
jgi:glycosyltransferase involved in cell wall biosynthesis